jgi:translation initiation factor IF-3
MRHVERFLQEGAKVKLTIMFRGREMTHPERGKAILDRVAEQVSGLASVEITPRLDGRNMTMVLQPLRQMPKRGDKRGSKSGDDDTEFEAVEAS